jgi:hypothetical protein
MTDPEDKTRTLPVRADGAPAVQDSGDVAALVPGQTVFEYRIDKMLGGGGFGITYLAQDVNLQLPVAIKEYFPGDLAVRAADLSVQRALQRQQGTVPVGPGALPRRGAGAGLVSPSQHRAGAALLQGKRHGLHRDGVRVWRPAQALAGQAARAGPARPAEDHLPA